MGCRSFFGVLVVPLRNREYQVKHGADPNFALSAFEACLDMAGKVRTRSGSNIGKVEPWEMETSTNTCVPIPGG